MRTIAFIRITDGEVFSLQENGEYGLKRFPKHICNTYTEERLSIREFIPVFTGNDKKFYSHYFKTCDENNAYIPECKICKMSYYNCLCSHND